MSKQILKAIVLNGENKSWLNLLTNNKVDAKTFEAKFQNKTDMFEVMSFRKYLLEKGRGQNILASQLNDVIKSNDRKAIIEALEELFLEPITDSNEFKCFLEEIKKGLTPEIILRLHKENKGNRFGTLVIAWECLLKMSNRKIS